MAAGSVKRRMAAIDFRVACAAAKRNRMRNPLLAPELRELLAEGQRTELVELLSELHPNDAASAYTRLVDMEIEPFLVRSTVIGILAQRLVRVLCDHCKQAYHPTQYELTQLGLDYERVKRRAERKIAPTIHAELERARRAIESGSTDYRSLEAAGSKALQQAGFRPDYFSIRDALTLQEPGARSNDLVILTAARIGRARLIDNVRATRKL